VSTNDEESLRQRTGDAAVVQDAFEAMPWPMAAVEGPSHTIVAANAACRALAGRPDLIGKPAWQVFQGFTRSQIADSLDLVYATGEPYSARDWPIQGDRYLDLTLTPWLGPGGLRGVLVTQVEVTNRVREGTAAQPPPITEARSRARNETIVVQEALLPSGLPVLPRVRIAARYLPAVADEPVGGDWFDAFALPDGRIALMVGDVADRGTAASAAMGRLRAILTHALTVQPDLAAVLTQADRFAAGDAALDTTTLCIALLDPADGTLSYATCGHPPPLLADSGGTARFLPGTGARPLGVGAALSPLSAALPEPSSAGVIPVPRSAVLAPGDVLLLYTDGLVERLGRTLDDGMADLAIVAGDSVANRTLTAWAAGTPAERASQLTVELLTRAGYGDDVTTLAAWRQPLPLTSLGIESPADRDAVTTLRHAFGDWLESLGIAFGDRQLAELAIAEVVTNAVDHAYPPGKPGVVRLEAAVGADGYLETRVSDRGRWRIPDISEEDRGQGLSVAAQFADELRVSHPPQDAAEPLGARGTVVAMRHRLYRQPMLTPLAVRPPGTRAAYPPFAVELAMAKSAPLVRVSGPVDFTTADQLFSRLLAACRAGVLPLTVDLSGATILATAGVRILYRIAAQLAAHEQDLTLISVPGSPAAAVLDLAGLPRTPR
jgi:anti-sigma regulatory factor (Ser/Thr protein kinase)/anti-anti-sigma regulatory factor